MLKEQLEKFVSPNYGKTHRTLDTYLTVSNYCRNNLSRLISLYTACQGNAQLLREIRNDIDYYIRRYHHYCIKQRADMRFHYYEVNADKKCDFEHLIPASRIRDLLLANVISIDQAVNAPTVLLSRSKHSLLQQKGNGSSSPDLFLPFLRYTEIFDAEFRTNDGVKINPNKWTLADHYTHFKNWII